MQKKGLGLKDFYLLAVIRRVMSEMRAPSQKGVRCQTERKKDTG